MNQRTLGFSHAQRCARHADHRSVIPACTFALGVSAERSRSHLYLCHDSKRHGGRLLGAALAAVVSGTCYPGMKHLLDGLAP